MNVLIVYAHPNPASLSHAALEQLRQGFAQAGHQVTLIDLYREQFDPVLVVNESMRRRDLLHDPYTLKYRELIAAADHLVFVYPVWWHQPPAILKGFFDRVFVSGFAYSYRGKREGALLPEGLLKDKSLWAVYTLDAPLLPALLDPGWIVLKFCLFWYCGLRKTKRLMLASVKRTSYGQREKWLRTVFTRAARL